MTPERPVRKKTPEVIVAINTLTGVSLGRIGNISERGVMLITETPIPEASVIQIQFLLRSSSGSPQRVELGVQCLWYERAASDRNYWNGCRIVATSARDESLIHDWLARIPT